MCVAWEWEGWKLPPTLGRRGTRLPPTSSLVQSNCQLSSARSERLGLETRSHALSSSDGIMSCSSSESDGCSDRVELRPSSGIGKTLRTVRECEKDFLVHIGDYDMVTDMNKRRNERILFPDPSLILRKTRQLKQLFCNPHIRSHSCPAAGAIREPANEFLQWHRKNQTSSQEVQCEGLRQDSWQ